MQVCLGRCDCRYLDCCLSLVMASLEKENQPPTVKRKRLSLKKVSPLSLLNQMNPRYHVAGSKDDTQVKDKVPSSVKEEVADLMKNMQFSNMTSCTFNINLKM